jgi:hypothetical protein
LPRKNCSIDSIGYATPVRNLWKGQTSLHRIPTNGRRLPLAIFGRMSKPTQSYKERQQCKVQLKPLNHAGGPMIEELSGTSHPCLPRRLAEAVSPKFNDDEHISLNSHAVRHFSCLSWFKAHA